MYIEQFLKNDVFLIFCHNCVTLSYSGYAYKKRCSDVICLFTALNMKISQNFQLRTSSVKPPLLQVFRQIAQKLVETVP